MKHLRHWLINRPDLLGKSFYDVLPKQIADQLFETDKEISETISPVTREYQVALPDGMHYYTTASFPLLDEADKVYALGSILTDVTLVNRGKEALYKSNQELQYIIDALQQLMETALDAICVMDEEGRFRQVSSTCETLFGYTSEELIGKKYIDLVHHGDVEKTNQIAAQIMSGKNVNDFENRYCRKDGHFIPISWVATWSAEDKQMYCIARDASQKKQTLEQLRQSGVSLANAQKIAQLGSWEVDLQKRLIYCSDEFFTIAGRTREEMGTDLDIFSKISHPDDITRLKTAFEKAIRKESAWDIEFRILQPNGNILYVHGKAEVEFNDVGTPILFKGTIQDISNRKRMEEERELVIQELTKMNADLKQFSFITSHNFRAPLSNIIGILNLINFTELGEHNKSMLDMLKTSAMNLNTTIEDLTKIMIIKNNVNADMCDVSLSDVYQKVESVFTNAIIEARGYIETDFQVPYVRFSPVYLESVLINLISNAVHYRSTDRTLLIKIKSTIDENGNTKLIVSDNGLGIDMNRQKDKIFGLYQRFHEHTTGQGLGLFIIKSQINALSGKIEVESEVDKGTTFTITFITKVSGMEFTIEDKHKASSRLVAKMS